MIENLNFVAIDFETANTDYSSICQIGLAFFENGTLVKEESHLINPEAYFDGYNISIHGITEENTKCAPTFKDFFPELCSRIENQVVIHHQPFDKIAYCQACELNRLEMSNTYWLDNAAVVRRTWEEFRQKGYGLKNIANHLGLKFKHHDACEDARTAGYVFIEACKITGKNIEEWTVEVESGKIKPSKKGPSRHRITGDLLKPITEFCDNINNPFYGKKVVISGTYTNWPNRKDLAKELKELGADIDSSVSTKTNYLCAGLGVGPSKLKNMQKNIDAGKDAAILCEQEILEILIENKMPLV